MAGAKRKKKLPPLNLGVQLLLLLVFLLVGGAAWMFFSLLPVAYGKGEVQEFVIQPGQNVGQIIGALHQTRLIRSEGAFKLLLSQSSIQAGSYLLSPSMPGWQIASILTSGQSQRIVVTVPEGFTNRQLETRLKQKALFKQEDSLKKAIQEIDLTDFAWLPRGAASLELEGFLFPDTYFFSPQTTPPQMVVAMLENFERRFNSLSDKLKQNSLSLGHLIILASLVEREGKSDEEMRKIASVLLNRLKIGMRLDVDATIRYALNKWEGPLTQEDLAVNSPYNTRRVKGLPPSPICNPGLRAIRAVLEAPETEFYYYLTDASGTTHFAKTLEEHNQQKAKYLR